MDFNNLKGPWEDVKAYLSDEKNMQTLLENGKKLREHVVFLGRLDHCYLCHLFPCADFSIFPSIVPEAYGLVLMESFSNGVIPLVSYYAGFKDGIDDVREDVGEEINDLMKILYEPQDLRIPKLIGNIVRLEQHSGLTECKLKLRKLAETKYDWRVRAVGLIKAFKSLI